MEILYHFKFEDAEEREFRLRFDDESLALLGGGRSFYPEWTRLEHHQCANCPLKAEQSPNCPIAERLSDVVETFKARGSAEKIEVTVTTEQRQFRKKASVAEGVSALMGLVMATSGCPVMDRLRPMVRTHLPFATHEETMYRFLSMYVFSQYFRMERGERPDWAMAKLTAMVEDFREVNRSFCARIRGICSNDANINAVVLLDCFAGITALFLKQKSLKKIEATYFAHFKKPPAPPRGGGGRVEGG